MNAESASCVVRWLRLTRKEQRAVLRLRLTAKTAREGVFATEQADLTDTQTPFSSSARCMSAPRTPSTLRFRMCGTAPAGLLTVTLGKAEKNCRSA